LEERRKKLLSEPLPEVINMRETQLNIPPLIHVQQENSLSNSTEVSVSESEDSSNNCGGYLEENSYSTPDVRIFIPPLSPPVSGELKPIPPPQTHEDSPSINTPTSQRSRSNSMQRQPVEQGDWNSRYQQAIEALRMFDGPVDIENSIDAHSNLVLLAQDFRYCCSIYGKIIISERFVPSDQKTIKPEKQLG
jgi:hypothetical protein